MWKEVEMTILVVYRVHFLDNPEISMSPMGVFVLVNLPGLNSRTQFVAQLHAVKEGFLQKST